MFSTSTLIRQIREEYQTMPGLKLSREQACRLWAVNIETCDAAIQALIDEGFLHTTGTGKFIALPRPAGAAAAHVRELNSRVASVRCPHCQKLNTGRESGTQNNVAGGTFRCIACGRIVSFTALSA